MGCIHILCSIHNNYEYLSVIGLLFMGDQEDSHHDVASIVFPKRVCLVDDSYSYIHVYHAVHTHSDTVYR